MSLLTAAQVLFLTHVTIMVLTDAWLGWNRPPDSAWHHWADSLESMTIQVMTGAVAFFGKAWLAIVYALTLQHASLGLWVEHPLAWLLAFLAYDVLGYGFHRWSHESNLGWAIHQVHHQPEVYNITVAMRTAPFRNLVDWVTLLPLAVVGVPLHVLAVLFVVHVAGQYWLHVRWIDRLPWLDPWMNTPSHHRVHHGCQPIYQDKNYGANLILWDKLFGTFAPESEEPVYGLVTPMPGFSPMRSVLRPFSDIWHRSRAWPWTDRLQVWARHPRWQPNQPRPVSSPEVRKPRPRKVSRAVLLDVLVAHVTLLSAPLWPSMGLWAAGVAGLGILSVLRVGWALDRASEEALP
jgi:sterol desaturase/sphingolipid hydroxylase (fatty acid hydroxylase superfamily)